MINFNIGDQVLYPSGECEVVGEIVSNDTIPGHFVIRNNIHGSLVSKRREDLTKFEFSYTVHLNINGKPYDLKERDRIKMDTAIKNVLTQIAGGKHGLK